MIPTNGIKNNDPIRVQKIDMAIASDRTLYFGAKVNAISPTGAAATINVVLAESTS